MSGDECEGVAVLTTCSRNAEILDINAWKHRLGCALDTPEIGLMGEENTQENHVDDKGKYSVRDDDKDVFQHVAVPGFRLNGEKPNKISERPRNLVNDR